MKIYLAGPMRGYPDFNVRAFMKAARELRDQGHIVFNPPEKDLETYGPAALVSAEGKVADVAPTGLTPRNVMRVDINWILDHAEAIALLPGWENSKGATVEKAMADFLSLETIIL